ncbi:hypothetical protein C7999DRAFT_18410 [Corynascus novoguineensis]|uniref:Transcription factor domain-containing protein n=1 Tax=Corynascus novoguineensis TaxID=1126955 RepID=A0AAN7HIA8_9PEZI|nr:hypothetical protein C7999DRAFT_18410 [Corynascus novoguineensis]
MADMKETNSTLQRVLTHLASAPVSEVVETVQKLSASDALSTLKHGEGADALCSRAIADGKVARIDAQALDEAPVKLPAKPWTYVAGDGLVSHLIADFFARSDDDSFVNSLSLIDQELFIRDMAHANPSQSQFCSPFLVNAICGLRSIASDKVRLVNEATGTNLTELFLAEAKQHFDVEACRRSLTTVQALYLFFMLTCHFNTNRSGSVYRLGALDILSKLDVEKAFASPSGRAYVDAEKRRALFKMYWGIFNFECILCHTYLKPPSVNLLPLAYFPGDTDSSQSAPNQVQRKLRTVPPTNRISDMQYRVMKYNSEPLGTIGDELDMRVRNDLLFQLRALENSLLPEFDCSELIDGHTIQLKIYLDMVAYNILRPLRSTTAIHCPRSSAASPPSSLIAAPTTIKPSTARTHLINLATIDIRLIDNYLARCATPAYAPALVLPLWSAVLTLIPFLPDPDPTPNLEEDDIKQDDGKKEKIRGAFSRGCTLLEQLESSLHGVRTLRRGILAVAWKLGVTPGRIPSQARTALGGLVDEVRRGEVELRHVPVDYVIAIPREIFERVILNGDGGCGGDGVGSGDNGRAPGSGGVIGLDLAVVLGEWEEALRMKSQSLEVSGFND